MRSNNLLEHVFECLKKYKWVWLVPTIAFMAIAGIYNKLIATKTYSARQSLILRDDLLGDSFKPSRFESQESLKSAQETILEIARKPHVIGAVLKKLGPASSWSFSTGDYPSDTVIESTQGDITLNAPNGGEFGKTEAVVLSVKTTNAERSRKFMNLLLDEVDSKLGEVRMLRLGSMQNELSRASINSMAALKSASSRLRDLERSFGSEITTIRGLNDPQGSGGFDLKLNQIRLEQREAAAQLASAKNQRNLLVQAEQSGGVDFVTSNELLELQPALGGIMTNLSTAMAQLAINEGRYTELHPELKRSRRAVERQKQQLFDSIGTTIKGLDSQIETLGELDQSLQQSIASMQHKLEELTEQRVPYATLEEEVKKKSEVYNEVQGRLAQVKSHAMASGAVNMLTRVDEPQVSSRPDQIGATQAGLLGGALGLIFGLGLVALLAPPFVDPRTANFSEGIRGSTEPNGSRSDARPDRDVSDSQMADAETPAESRLKSVTAMQRSATQRTADLLGGLGGAAQISSADDTGSNLPDSIARHMAAIKQNAAQAIAPKRREEKVAETAKPESTPPVAMPKFATDQTQSPTEAPLPRPESAPVSQSVPIPTRAAEPANPVKNRGVSSADVVAAFKKLRGGKSESEINSESKNEGTATDPASGITGGAAFKTSNAAIPNTPPQMESPARSAAQSSLADQLPQQSLTRDLDGLRDTAKTIEAPEIIIAERARSPRVPDSITSGRITAESLLKSTEQNISSDDQESASNPAAAQKIQQAQSRRFSTQGQDPVATALPEGAIQSPNDAAIEKSRSFSRTPSITDYARSLDQQSDSLLGNQQSDNSDVDSAKRKSNVRPLDIARSLEEPIAVPQSASDLDQSASNSTPEKSKQSRAKTMSELVGAMENSVAGLMREAKNSSLILDPPTAPNSSSVAPSEKTSPQKPASAVTPEPRGGVSSEAIPTQIKNLSSSFSSFARPTDPQS